MWGWTYVGCGPGVWSCLVLTGRDPACSYVIDFLKRLLFKLPPPLGTGQFTLLKSGLYWRPAVSRDWGIRNQLSLFACFSLVHGSVVPEPVLK